MGDETEVGNPSNVYVIAGSDKGGPTLRELAEKSESGEPLTDAEQAALDEMQAAMKKAGETFRASIALPKIDFPKIEFPWMLEVSELFKAYSESLVEIGRTFTKMLERIRDDDERAFRERIKATTDPKTGKPYTLRHFSVAVGGGKNPDTLFKAVRGESDYFKKHPDVLDNVCGVLGIKPEQVSYWLRKESEEERGREIAKVAEATEDLGIKAVTAMDLDDLTLEQLYVVYQQVTFLAAQRQGIVSMVEQFRRDNKRDGTDC